MANTDRIPNQDEQLYADLIDHEHQENNERNRVKARIRVNSETENEVVGEFTVFFNEQRSNEYIADFSTVEYGSEYGSGEYEEYKPPFWPVEEIVSELENKYDHKFKAINSGPRDF